jgi:hypothetical protein
VVEGSGFENRRTRKGSRGSNPFSSAVFPCRTGRPTRTRHCGTAFGGANNCDPTGLSLRSDAVKFGNVSTASFIAGGVLAAGAAGLWLFAPSTSVEAGPTVGSGGAGLTVRGTF